MCLVSLSCPSEDKKLPIQEGTGKSLQQLSQLENRNKENKTKQKPTNLSGHKTETEVESRGGFFAKLCPGPEPYQCHLQRIFTWPLDVTRAAWPTSHQGSAKYVKGMGK